MPQRETDWKRFTKRVPGWRERYLEKVNRELVDTLRAEAPTPTEVFWRTKERMDEEAEILRACFDGHSRSKLVFHLYLMHGHGIVDDEDLEGFSQDVQDRITGPGSDG